MTSLAYDHNLARVTALHPDRVELAFDLDHDWPWLTLPPQHLVLLEKYQYFGSLTALWAMEIFEPGVFTALTGFEWTCPLAPPGAGYGVRGVCGKLEAGAGKAFTFDVFAADGTPLMTSRGAGVAFPNRDYKGWRAHAKQKAQAIHASRGAPTLTDFAPVSAVGLGSDGISFVAPLSQDDDGIYTDALVTTETGFHPRHPFHTGSGDHVNAAHLFDCVMQAAHLVLDADKPLHCAAGRAEFTRYIELGIPFRIRLIGRQVTDAGHTELTCRLSQLGRDNTTISFALQG